MDQLALYEDLKKALTELEPEKLKVIRDALANGGAGGSGGDYPQLSGVR